MSELLDRLREHNLAVVEIHTGVQLSDSLAVYLLTGERLQPAQTPPTAIDLLRRTVRRIVDYRGDHIPNCDCATCKLVHEAFGWLDTANTQQWKADPSALRGETMEWTKQPSDYQYNRACPCGGCRAGGSGEHVPPADQPAQTPAPDFPIKPKPETNDLVTLDETRLIELSNAGNEATCAEVEALAFHALHVHAQGALVQKVCAELARRASPQGERDETLALAAANLATQKWLETTPSYAYQTEVLKRLRAASPPPETPEKP